MYLHLENNILLPKKKIIGIFDLDTTASSKITNSFLRDAEKKGRVFDICQDLPRCFILVGEDFGEISLYISGKNSRNLKRRFETSFARDFLRDEGDEDGK
ncbi:MAG: DUF370 domain-containing protein [Eubacteriales bacterium]